MDSGRVVSASQPHSRRRVYFFLLLSLIVHTIALPVLIRTANEPSAQVNPARRVSLVDQATLRALQKQKNDGKSQAVLAKRDEPKLSDAKGQIVDLPPPATPVAPPENARFLSEYNTRAERETSSRLKSTTSRHITSEPTKTRDEKLTAPNADTQATAIVIGPQKAGADKSSTKSSSTAFEVPRLRARDRLALRTDSQNGTFRNQSETDGVEGNGTALKLSLGDGTQAQKGTEHAQAPTTGPALADLLPKDGVLAQINGSPFSDFHPDVEPGEGTFLNSREFKYASFFNRLKRGVSQHWHPNAEYQRRDPTGNIYGFRSRITVVDITISIDGTVKQVQLRQSSGLDFLDNEATSAVQRAGPFPNPPKGLFGDNPDITFAFGFHLEFSQQGLPF